MATKQKITLPQVSGTLRPVRPKKDAVTGITRRALKERGVPCDVTWVTAKCFGPTGVRGKRQQIKDWREGLANPRTGDEGILRAECSRLAGELKPGFYKKRRVGSVELALLSPEQAAAAKTRPGPHVRICYRTGKKGILVPVKNARELKKISDTFKKCVHGKRDKEASCARSIFPSGTLGRLERHNKKR